MDTISYNDPKYKLLYIVGNEAAPEFDYDEEGNCFQWESIVPYDFLKRINRIKFPFTYDDYINNKDIIAMLIGYEIDIEQFWFAMLFIYDFTWIKCINVLKLGETAKVQIENLKEFLSGINSFTMSADGKKKLVINESIIINDLKHHLETLLADESFDLGFTSINLKQPSNYSYSTSDQMGYAATRFIKLFEALNLPIKRGKYVYLKYQEIDGEKNPVENSKYEVSFNKMLFISRLLYFMKFTNNISFLLDDNSLKGILKQYDESKINSFNTKYFL